MPLEIVPSIDLRGGRVVRLKQGDYGRQINYDVDPLDVARSYADAGAAWLHVVDLDGAKAGHPAQTELIAKIADASGMTVQAGGGVRSTEDVRQLLEAGVSRVVVGTKAIEDGAWFQSLVQDPVFAHKLVLALDARDGIVATRGWTQASGVAAVDLARQIAAWPVGAILYTDVAKDGMLQGSNVEQTRRLAEAAGAVPVIASGGVGTIEHVRQLVGSGAWGVIVGRSLYEGTLDLRQAIALGRAS